MLVKKFTKNNIVHLTYSSTLEEAAGLMDQLEVDLYPVVDEENGVLIGQIRRSALGQYQDYDTPIEQIELEREISVQQDKHIFEAIRLMLKHEIRVLPVVDHENRYQGLIRKQEMMEALGELLNLSELGSILTIEMEQYDFTLTKLIELIETEGAKILGLAVETPVGQDNNFRVSIKLNTQKTGNITATLRRFGYNVTTNTENDFSEIDYQARASELMNYIDM